MRRATDNRVREKGSKTVWGRRRLLVTVLTPAIAAGILIALLNNLAVSYSIDVSPSGVSVKYVRVNPLVPHFMVRVPKPRIRVTDAAGKQIAGVIVNIFAGLPQASVTYLGSVSGERGSALLPPEILSKVRHLLTLKWRSALGSVSGFKTSLLAFIDVLVPAGKGAFRVYSFVKAIPVNLWMLAQGYRIAAIKVTVNTAEVKPTVVKLSSPAPLGKGGGEGAVSGGVESTYSEVGSSCYLVRVLKGTLVYYCSKWVLEKTYAHITNKLIPIVMARISAFPQALGSISMFFHFSDSTLSWFKIYMSVKVWGSAHVTLQPWQLFKDNFNFGYSMVFANSMWSSDKPSFKGNAILGIGFYGSAFLGEFRRYEAIRYCTYGECVGAYHPTSVTANITLFDINAVKEGGTWKGRYGYVVVNNPSMNAGLGRFWELMMSHSTAGVKVCGRSYAQYYYDGINGNGVDMGVDLLDFLALFMPHDEFSKVSEGFPLDVGISWGCKNTLKSAILIFAKTYFGNYFKNYYVLLRGRVLNGVLYVGSSPVKLEAMYFNIYAYPPQFYVGRTHTPAGRMG